MKFVKSLNQVAVLVFLFLGLNACRDRIVEEYSYKANVPVYMSAEELKGSLKSEAARPLVNPGKIHIVGNTLYIIEQFEGIHVIDNSDPSNPKGTAFINVPGVIDIASKNGVMYVDSYTDLVALDITNPMNVTEVKRVEDVFTQDQNFWASLPPTNNDYPIGIVDPEKGIVVGWVVEEITEEYEVNNGWGCWNCQTLEMDAFTSNGGARNMSPSAVNYGVTGVSGSMARFSIYKDALYTLDLSDLNVYDISTVSAPTFSKTVSTNLQVETLFNLEDNLFIGTTTGMLIYNLSDPFSPTYTSGFAHVASCDPVVVEGNTAYVTLRSGNTCGGASNQLDVLDVEDLSSPELLRSYEMTNPHGLGIDNGTLFICDGDAGLRVYDAKDPMNITANPLAHFEDIHAYDVIPLGNVLLMIGEDGFMQYDYSDVTDIQLLSVIPVVKI